MLIVDLKSSESERGGLEDVCRLSAPGSTVTTTPHPVKRATKVVVVLNGCLVRCLRRVMATDLVFEVWVMVLRGLLHDHAQGPEGVDRV